MLLKMLAKTNGAYFIPCSCSPCLAPLTIFPPVRRRRNHFRELASRLRGAGYRGVYAQKAGNDGRPLQRKANRVLGNALFWAEDTHEAGRHVIRDLFGVHFRTKSL